MRAIFGLLDDCDWAFLGLGYLYSMVSRLCEGRSMLLLGGLWPDR
jgi:hypothetical protein